MRVRNSSTTALGPFLALLGIVAFFAIADNLQEDGGHFLSLRNAQNVVVQFATVAVAALGMTLIIISGGLDLSVGTGMALCAIVLAWFLQNDYAPWLAASAGILTGCLIGFLNGLLVTSLRVVPFIVTLGTMTIFLGLAKLIGQNRTIRPTPEQVPDWMKQLLNPRVENSWMLFPPGVWVLLLLAVGAVVLLHYTVLGSYLKAVGGNEQAARFSGIPISATRLAVYTIAGFTVGVAGLLMFTRLSSANPTSGTGKELLVIASVIIGGASLSGGRGSIVGTLIGALIMQVISNGCTALRLQDPIQEIVIGTVIVTAVAVDQLRQRRKS